MLSWLDPVNAHALAFSVSAVFAERTSLQQRTVLCVRITLRAAMVAVFFLNIRTALFKCKGALASLLASVAGRHILRFLVAARRAGISPLQGKQVEEPQQASKKSLSPPEPEHRPPQAVVSTQPTDREIAAANAARARLGHGSEEQAQHSQQMRLPTGPEPMAVDVEYVSTAELAVLADPDGAAQVLLERLQSNDWTETIQALNTARQLVVRHGTAARPLLETLLPLVLKSVKNLRSSVSKTAIMCCADLFSTYGEDLLPLIDDGGVAVPGTSLLHQLLLKVSSNDKRFVIEEAQRALQSLVDSMQPPVLLEKLLPYAKHRNPKVRGKVALVVCSAVTKASLEEVKAADAGGELLKVAGGFISDNTPDAREAARQIIPLLRAAFEAGSYGNSMGCNKENAGAGNGVAASGEGEEVIKSPWEMHCMQHLNPSAMAAVLKASI